MKDTLVYLLKSIVENPDDIVVDETVEETKTLLTVHANQTDIGKIIGKQGRIIRALRDLIKLIAAKHNVYVDIVIAE